MPLVKKKRGKIRTRWNYTHLLLAEKSFRFLRCLQLFSACFFLNSHMQHTHQVLTYHTDGWAEILSMLPFHSIAIAQVLRLRLILHWMPDQLLVPRIRITHWHSIRLPDMKLPFHAGQWQPFVPMHHPLMQVISSIVTKEMWRFRKNVLTGFSVSMYVAVTVRFQRWTILAATICI